MVAADEAGAGAASAAAASGPGIKGVRLILADASIGGGQRVKTFNTKPLAIKDVLSMLSEHLGLLDICKRHGTSVDELSAEDGSVTVTGFDGPKRVPIRGDPGLISFISCTQNTSIPSVEVQLGRKGAPAADGAGTGVSCRQPADRIEQLEDANYKLLRASDKLARRIDEMERTMRSMQEENRRNIEVAVRELTTEQVRIVREFDQKVVDLQAMDKSILGDLDVVRQHGFKVEQADVDHHEEMKKEVKELTVRMEEMFEAVDEQIKQLQEEDARLTAEDERQQGVLDEHHIELGRLDDVKVDRELWQHHEDLMDKRITKEMKEVNDRLTVAEADLNTKIVEAKEIQKRDHQEISATVEEHKQHNQAERDRIEADLAAGLKHAAEELERVRLEVVAFTESKVKALADHTEERFVETKSVIMQKDAAIHKKVDDLATMTESTFKAVNERFEEMVRVSRARMGTIEKDLVESNALLRADVRNDIERCRADYEQEAARLTNDLDDLHTKYDVSKQEITFQQEKLIEQREWAQRQLTETATATRAVQVDAQEGLAAATKMLHALRDDAVSFRDKMAKYISLLQHSSDSQGDAIASLESQRGKIRNDLDILVGDHKAYTGDMDNWADDVRMKVERLFRAMEPAKVEWRIHRAFKRSKELKKPLAVKSPTFSLRGLREVQLEFYPEGTNNSPEGKAILRVYLPPGTHVRFQVWVGFASDGAVDTKPNGSLTLDMQFDDWKSQIQEDGSLPVKLEMIRDFSNADESLSTEVRVESP